MHIATHAHVSRRSFLKGLGISLSLPLLDAMTPAFAQAAAKATAPRRFIAMNASLGFHGPYFFPQGAGRDYVPSPYLDVLKDLRRDFTVFSGLSHAEQSGANGHTSELTWLTSAKRPGLAGFKNTVSLDQFIAGKVGVQTRFPYLALSNGGSSLSWTDSGVQIPGESSPSKLFKQLFLDGTPDEVNQQVAGLQRGRSILDTVLGEAKKLHRELGKRDQEKLDQYFTSVRDLESRLVQNEAWARKPKPKIDAHPPTDITNRNDAIGRTRMMNDLVVLALQTDSTRTITFSLGGLNSVPVIEGVQNDWHNLSHHGQDEKKIEELKLIELAEFGALRDFLTKLKAAQENGRSLLDSTAVLYGSNLGNASAHDWHNIPVLVAGGGFKHGQHLAFDTKNNLAFANLFVALARHMGVETDTFGYSTKPGLPGFEPA
ncbi:MAG: DUF1552 domain-containing protein [Chthoniobacteraceae bacterium]